MEAKTIKTISVIFGTGISYLFGGWDAVLKILALLIAMDYITGLMKSAKNKTIDSEIGFNGLIRKACIFFVVILANQLDTIVAAENPIFRTMACYFYISNEGISITENIVALGVPLPGGIVNMLRKMKESNDTEAGV